MTTSRPTRAGVTPRQRYDAATSLVSRASIRPGMMLLLIDPTPELAARINQVANAETLTVWLLDSMRSPSAARLSAIQAILTLPRTRETAAGLNFDFPFRFDRVFAPVTLHDSAWGWTKPGGAVCLDTHGEEIAPVIEEWAETLGGFIDPIAKTIVVYKTQEF